MKIEVEVFECDVCLRLGYAGDHETWFDVSRNGDSQEACSADCLMKMGRQIKAEELGTEPPRRGRPPKVDPLRFGESAESQLNGKRKNGGKGGSGGVTPNHEPCQFCGEVIPTKQGLGAHIRLGHKMKRNAEGEWAPIPS